jgi:flagellar protein FliL
MANETAAPPKGGSKGLIVWVLLALVAVGGGAALPFYFGRSHEAHPPKKIEPVKNKQIAIPFGDPLAVNLGEDRLNRFLRVKFLVAVEEADAHEVTDLMTKQKAFLKSWLISYLSDQPLAEVGRRVGVNRIRREMRDQFNATLFPNGEEKILDILFDEFLVQ